MNEQESKRRAQCAVCVGKCWAWKVGKLDPASPSAGCVRMIWDRPAVPLVVPPSAAPALPVPSTQSSLWRTLRGWRRAGLAWASRPVRRQILPICRGCEFHRVDARTGLVACAAGCNCGVSAVSVIRAGARCKQGLWTKTAGADTARGSRGDAAAVSRD